MSEIARKSEEQMHAEADVDDVRKELGPFVVAAERTRMAMLFTSAKYQDNPIVFANDSFLSLFGYDREEVLGQSLNLVMTRGADPSVLPEIEAVLKGSSNTDPETWYRRKDGSEFWASIFVSPVHDQSGAIVQHFVSFIDLTKHKHAAAQLQRAADQLELKSSALEATLSTLEAALENMEQGIIMVDSNGIVQVCNHRAIEMLDLPPDYRHSKPSFSDFVAHQFAIGEFTGLTEERASWLNPHSDLQSAPPLYERTRPNGAVLEVRTVRLPDGIIVRTFNDITARHEAEGRLRQSQRMEAIGQLTGGIAHDFNNLLGVIIGNAEFLAEEITDPELQAMARMTEEAASWAAELTQKLLAFGRRQSLTPAPVVLDEVALNMKGLLQRTLGEHIEIQIAAYVGGAAALVDRTLLESALLNLAVNARDAMPKGGTLTISTGERMAGPQDGSIPSGEPVVYVTVSDTGTGMAPEVLAHAFEPFFSTKEVGHGTGLGLAMVYGFAQQSGGHVSIESRQGEGTFVTIVLRAVGREAVEAAQVPGNDDRTLPTKGGERILVVEDELSVRQYVETQLKSLGYEVTSVAAGHEAMALLEKRECFDLLFSDVVLPRGMSGVELSRLAAAQCQGLKVLLTSGYSEEIFQQHGRPEEGRLVLKKPYRRKELAQTLRKVLDG